MDKRISTITCTHNRAYLLPRAVTSLANQTRKSDEWLIIDDASMDGTTALLKHITMGRSDVVYKRFDTRVGVAKAKNWGLSEVDPSSYIHIMDDDDVLLPNFYERMLAEVKDNDIIFCPFYVVKEIMQPDGTLVEISREIMQDWQGFIPGKQKDHPYISMVCSLFRPGFFKDYGLFDENMKFCLEWATLLKAELQGAKFKYLDEILGEIHWRWGNWSDNLGFNKSPIDLQNLRPMIDDIIKRYGGGK